MQNDLDINAKSDSVMLKKVPKKPPLNPSLLQCSSVIIYSRFKSDTAFQYNYTHGAESIHVPGCVLEIWALTPTPSALTRIPVHVQSRCTNIWRYSQTLAHLSLWQQTHAITGFATGPPCSPIPPRCIAPTLRLSSTS